LATSNHKVRPSGNTCGRRCVMKPSLHDNLMERVLDRENLQRAWKRVKSNQGAPGIDGLPIEEFAAYARNHWSNIRQALNDGSYRPQPVKRVTIPKPDGGERHLGIPTVTDRVIQQAIAQVLNPIFDPGFSESSFGFRERRSAHGALKQVKGYVQQGRRIAVDLDLAKFFDTVNHDVLMARIGRKVRDKRLLALIGHYLRAGVSIKDSVQPSEIGTPQGGPLTPATI
jgi:RNA-directed DNA polymerase